MENIVVTGGAGFIGSNLCEKLIKENKKVVCVDNFLTGFKKNIAPLRKKDNFQLIEHNITKPLHIEDIEIDKIFNLASPASPVHYQKNPIQTVKANTAGVINILGLAKEHGAKILQASTSEVYGDPEKIPQTEDYYGNVNPIGPRACYDEGKRCAETLYFDYYRKYNLDIKVARIFNTYGPNMAINDGRVISNFVVQSLKEQDLTIDGDGSQTRSFCFVSDMVDGLVKMMRSSTSITGPINLGNTNEITIKELAKIIRNKTGSSSKLNFSDKFRKDDPMRRQPSVRKAKEVLDWNPEIDLENGIEETIAYFKAELKDEE